MLNKQKFLNKEVRISLVNDAKGIFGTITEIGDVGIVLSYNHHQKSRAYIPFRAIAAILWTEKEENPAEKAKEAIKYFNKMKIDYEKEQKWLEKIKSDIGA